MSDHATVTGVATGLMAGSGGYVVAQVLQAWRERRAERVAERRAPAEIDSTISAGAKDAVTALRETLAEYRAELAELREKCDRTERVLAETRSELLTERGRRADLEAVIEDLRQEGGPR